MSLQWKVGCNPFKQNYFGVLKLGPYATRQEIVQRCRRLCQELRAGVPQKSGEVQLDEHALNEAARELGNYTVRAEEMLLAHAPALKDKSRLKSLFARLDDLTRLPAVRPNFSLVHPLAVMWFLPAPGVETASMPAWRDLGLGEAGDAEDMESDIVFDE